MNHSITLVVLRMLLVENGMLKLPLDKELYMGSNYTSARILTKGKSRTKIW